MKRFSWVNSDNKEITERVTDCNIRKLLYNLLTYSLIQQVQKE